MPKIDENTTDMFANSELPVALPKIGREASADEAEAPAEEWAADPRRAFVRWAQSRDANGGKGFSAKSIVTYASMWGKFVKFCPKNPALADESIIERFIASLEGRVRNAKVSKAVRPDPNGSRRRYLSMLDKLHDHLVKHGIRKQNGAQRLLFELDRRVRAIPRPLPVALLPNEEKSLWTVVEDWPCTQWRDCRDKALLALLIGSGVKVAEARSVRVSDLSLQGDAPFIRVLGGRNERFAPITAASLPVLAIWIKKKNVIDPVGEWLFPGDDQPMLSSSTIYRVVAKAIEKADLSPHHTGPSVLRHTFATRQLRAGKKLSDVSAWLGHEQEASTVVYKLMVVDPGGARPV